MNHIAHERAHTQRSMIEGAGYRLRQARKAGLKEGLIRTGFNGGWSSRAQQGANIVITVINIQLLYKNSIETSRHNQIKYKDLKDKL